MLLLLCTFFAHIPAVAWGSNAHLPFTHRWVQDFSRRELSMREGDGEPGPIFPPQLPFLSSLPFPLSSSLFLSFPVSSFLFPLFFFPSLFSHSFPPLFLSLLHPQLFSISPLSYYFFPFVVFFSGRHEMWFWRLLPKNLQTNKRTCPSPFSPRSFFGLSAPSLAFLHPSLSRPGPPLTAWTSSWARTLA